MKSVSYMSLFTHRYLHIRLLFLAISNQFRQFSPSLRSSHTFLFYSINTDNTPRQLTLIESNDAQQRQQLMRRIGYDTIEIIDFYVICKKVAFKFNRRDKWNST